MKVIELWKPISGYEGLYEISCFGRIKSLAKNGKKERMLKSSSNGQGYRHVVLCKNDIKKTIDIHRLVASAFVPNPEGKIQINHIDGVKGNNFYSNIEWCTQSENITHAYKCGLMIARKKINKYNSNC